MMLKWMLLLTVSVRLGSGQPTLGAATLGGTIRDESGAAIADARVRLTDESKGLIRQSTSDRSGFFIFPALNAGMYSVIAEKSGFRAVRVRDVRLEIGEQASVEIRLTIGSVRTAITVLADNSTELDAGANTLGTVVDAIRVRELPLNGRSLLSLAGLAATVSEPTPASNLFTSNVGPPDRTIVLPGTLPSSAAYALDGINVRSSRDGELSLSPSLAGVDEFKVQESFLMPDQGVSPAVVNIVTRSGGNQFHGEAFEFLRNRDLDARSFFAAAREDLRRNQFGVTTGGPLRKDRAWFYGFYEGTRQLTTFSTAGYSPTREMFRGDFSGTGHTIYDPASYTALSGVRQPFPNNTIPVNRINPVATNLLRYYLPGSSLSSIPSNIFGNPANRFDDDQGGLRVDLAVNDRHQLLSRVFGQTSPTVQPGLYPLSGISYANESQLEVLQDVWTVNPRAVTTTRIGFLRAVAVGGNEAHDMGPMLASIGITNTFDQNGVTAINLQGYSSFGRSNGQVGNRDNTWQFDEEVEYTSGKHTIALGAELHYRRGWHLNGNSAALGSLSFQPTYTAQLTKSAQGQLAPVANTGDAFADFLLGMPATGLSLG